MIYYADTSALLKKYVDELGSDRVQSLLEECDTLWTSALTELELVSAVERAKRERRLDSPNYRYAVAAIEKDLDQEVYSVIAMSAEIFKLAKRLIRQRRLRVQDAIQLASVLVVDRRSQSSVLFLCADRLLLEAARLEGVRCLNPITP